MAYFTLLILNNTTSVVAACPAVHQRSVPISKTSGDVGSTKTRALTAACLFVNPDTVAYDAYGAVFFRAGARDHLPLSLPLQIHHNEINDWPDISPALRVSKENTLKT